MKWLIISILFLFSHLIYFSNSQTCESLIDKSPTEADLIQSITSEFESIKLKSTTCIKQLLISGNFKALESYATLLNDNNIKFKEDLKNSINNIQTQLDDLANKFRFNDEDYQKVTPSLKWAQSLSRVFIQIKFSHRLDTPGCTEVENIRTTIEDTHVTLIGECVLSEVPIQFNLDLPLIELIDKDDSSYIYKLGGSYFDLKKKEAKYWPNLISEEKKKEFNQIAIWYEMKEKYANEIKEYEAPSDEDKSYEEIEKELKEQMRQERKKNKDKEKGNKRKKNKKKRKTKKETKSDL